MAQTTFKMRQQLLAEAVQEAMRRHKPRRFQPGDRVEVDAVVWGQGVSGVGIVLYESVVGTVLVQTTDGPPRVLSGRTERKVLVRLHGRAYLVLEREVRLLTTKSHSDARVSELVPQTA